MYTILHIRIVEPLYKDVYPSSEDISFNQDTMHGPIYIEKCMKQPLKWGHFF